MSPLPVKMRDRWASRPEPPEGKGTVYWHVLMSRYPEARATVMAAQEALRGIPGLHFTPQQWFHMTVQLVGSTDDIGQKDLTKILNSARTALSSSHALDVSLGRVLYHPEAVMLAVEPADQLRALQDRVRSATASALGRTDTSTKWVPHVTVAYSTAGHPADRIVSALDTSVSSGYFPVDHLSLVVQWGPERQWNWDEVGTVKLLATSTSTSTSTT